MNTNVSAIDPARVAAEQAAFTAALPVMTRVMRRHLHKAPPRLREELLAEAQGAAWAAWLGLVRRGQDPRQVGIEGIAFNAARYARRGRALGCGSRSKGMDTHDWRLAARSRMARVSLQEVVPVSDPRPLPIDEVALRLDFSTWLNQLAPRRRRVAERLTASAGTSELARELGVGPAAISQARAWLTRSWRTFQAGATSPRT